jgi:integrase
MGRRASSGYVEKRENSMRVFFEWQGETRKETVRLNGKVLLPTAANVKYAMRLAKTVQEQIAAGTFDYAEHFPDSKHAVAKAPAAERTFGQLADLWHKSKGKLEGATKDQYGTAVRFWKRMFGEDTLLSKLDHVEVESKVGAYEWSSAKQHNNYMIALRGIFGMEYRAAKAADHPCASIENMKVVRKIPDPLSIAERDKVLADMRERYDERVYAYYLFAFFTGMRPEEIIALRWSDIDFASGTARVQRVRTFKGSERDGSKTHAERDVDLVPQALQALKIMAAHTKMLPAEREGDEDTAADIFQNPVTRKPWHDERSQRDHYWKPSLKRLGIRARRAYCTRHTYCTVALMGRVDPAYIAAQAGHSVKMLLEKYTRWMPENDGGAAKKALAAAMGGVTDISPQFPRERNDEAKSLIPKGEIGRRDWTRTNKSGSNGV